MTVDFDVERLRRNWLRAEPKVVPNPAARGSQAPPASIEDLQLELPSLLGQLRLAVEAEFGAQPALRPFVQQVDAAARACLLHRGSTAAQGRAAMLVDADSGDDPNSDLAEALSNLEDMLEVYLSVPTAT